MTPKPGNFWSIQGDFISRHHNEPQVQLYVPKEETFTMPLTYIDVTRATCTNLDVLILTIVGMWTRIEVYQILGQDSRKFTLLKEKNPPKGYTWSGKRLTKNQATTRPENLWPDVWSKMGKAARKKEKQERANENPESRQCSKVERHLFHRSGRWRR